VVIPSGYLEMIEVKTKKSKLIILIVIFLLALLVRIVYLIEVKDSPILTHPGLDMQAYDLWAQRIAQGEWLGKKVFYQSPLYPYLLALFYVIFGRKLFVIYFIQLFLGALDCLLIYGIGKRAFNERVGMIAGLVSALYAPFIFYQALLLKTYLGIFLIDLSIFLVLGFAEDAKKAKGFFAGISLGLSSLVRDNFVLFFFWFFGWLWLKLRQKGLLARIWLFASGFVLIVGACALRNYIVGRDFVLTTSQAGQNFYIGNHLKNFTGTYQSPDFVCANPFFEENDFRREAEKRLGRSNLKPSQISWFWFKQSFKEIREEPSLFVQRLLLKMALFWNRREIADNVSIYLFRREFSYLLRYLADFGWIAPFALLGLCLAFLRKRAGVLLGFVSIYWLSTSAFYIFARYRLAVVGVVLCFFGFALEEIYFSAKKRAWREFLVMILGVLIFGVLSWAPLLKPTLDYAYYNLGNAYMRSGDYGEAILSYQKAIKENPSQAEFWTNLGKALERKGLIDDALRAYKKAVKLNASSALAQFGLGKMLFMRGELEQAENHLKKALELNPAMGEAKIYLQMIQSKKHPSKEQ